MGCLTLHLFKKLNKKLKKIMANITELTAKVDALQTALDAEQQQIADAIAALNQSITDLQALVADGGTAEERQALADKLDAIKTDLEGTVAP
jgi:septal ring factor EnvC (AmiA/AmiB activator)